MMFFLVCLSSSGIYEFADTREHQVLQPQQNLTIKYYMQQLTSKFVMHFSYCSHILLQ